MHDTCDSINFESEYQTETITYKIVKYYLKIINPIDEDGNNYEKLFRPN